jgi:hypothetical protein
LIPVFPALVLALAAGVEPSPALRPWFTDVTRDSGIPSLRFGEGANFCDLDGDGLPELFAPVVKGRDRLFRNLGALRFREEALEKGLTESDGITGVFADFDRDGRADLLVVRGAYPYGENLLYLQDGQGIFRDRSLAAGISGKRNGISATAADFDGDGDLDLFVANWGTNVLYRNRAGDKHGPGASGDALRFTDATLDGGLAEEGRSWGALSSDFNGDGRPDLFVFRGGDGKGQGCRLYLNRGNGSFQDATASSGLGATGWAMGAVSADFDGDGDFDLFVTGYDGPDRLYLNDGTGRFSDATPSSGITSSRSVGAAAGCLDSDLLPDLVVAGFAGPVRVFRNLGGGRFSDVGPLAGLGPSKRNEGVALADADGDGDLDLYATNYDGENRLYRNNENPTRFLKVRPLSDGSPAVGAVVRLYRAGVQGAPLLAAAEVQTTYGYGSQSPPEIVFPLPDAGPFRLSVTLPGGGAREAEVSGGTVTIQ